ncbi:MAG: hypothetical protein RMJ35_03515 [Phycisphaerales bacterium]|nr:hypothetical protein [Phycisphaerales bacterium]
MTSFVAAGCEEPTELPAPATAPAEPADEPAIRRPTTQQLVEGRWKTVTLSVLPITLEVPESWQQSAFSESGLLTLEGWTPSGEVQLRFSARPPLTADKFEGFVNGARKAMEARGDRKLRFELHEKPGFKVLEQQFSEERRAMLATDAAGNLVEMEGTPLKWSFLIFLPDAEGYKSYELGFVELSLEHYERDKEFFQRVMSSLRHDGAALPSSQFPR